MEKENSKNVKVGDKLYHKIHLKTIVVEEIFEKNNGFGDFSYHFEDNPTKGDTESWKYVSKSIQKLKEEK